MDKTIHGIKLLLRRQPSLCVGKVGAPSRKQAYSELNYFSVIAKQGRANATSFRHYLPDVPYCHIRERGRKTVGNRSGLRRHGNGLVTIRASACARVEEMIVKTVARKLIAGCA